MHFSLITRTCGTGFILIGRLCKHIMSYQDFKHSSNSFSSISNVPKGKKMGQRSVRLEIPASIEIQKKLSSGSAGTSPSQGHSISGSASLSNFVLPKSTYSSGSLADGTRLVSPSIFHVFPPNASPSFVFDVVTPEVSFPFTANPAHDLSDPRFLIYFVCVNSVYTSPIQIRLNGNPIMHLMADQRPIDITPFLAPFSQQNWVIVDTGSFVVPFTILGVWVAHRTLSDIIREISQNEKFIYNDISSICPISGRQIVTPSRGVNCEHDQCFDFGPYITSRQAIGEWFCPICKQPLPLSEIRIGQRPTIDMPFGDEAFSNSFDEGTMLWEY